MRARARPGDGAVIFFANFIPLAASFRAALRFAKSRRGSLAPIKLMLVCDG